MDTPAVRQANRRHFSSEPLHSPRLFEIYFVQHDRFFHLCSQDVIGNTTFLFGSWKGVNCGP